MVPSLAAGQTSIGDKTNIDLQDCYDDAFEWLENEHLDLIFDYFDRLDEAEAIRDDRLEAAENLLMATVAGCTDFWCINQALADYNAAADEIEADYDYLVDLINDLFDVALENLTSEYEDKLALCEGDPV